MRPGLLVAVGAVVLAGAGTAAVIGFGGADAAESSGGADLPATVAVTRGTLTETEDVDGTIGYGTATTVVGRLSGMVTGVPTVGKSVSRGQVLFRVDAKPVLLMYGDQPLYRRLSPGVEGADVRLAEENLRDLGYTGFTVDDEYTSATADAVERWQEANGLDGTGALDVGRVVVAPGPVRVSALRANLGDNGTGPIFDYTGSTRLVMVKLDVRKRDLATVGDKATVKLPDGRTVQGAVIEVGTVATAAAGANGQATVTVDVTVSVPEQDLLSAYDAAPVDVTLVSEERKDVLTVPVGALLALAEGGYGVQVVDGSTTTIVAVQTGLFAGGRVEISGAGITAGTRVGVPS